VLFGTAMRSFRVLSLCLGLGFLIPTRAFAAPTEKAEPKAPSRVRQRVQKVRAAVRRGTVAVFGNATYYVLRGGVKAVGGPADEAAEKLEHEGEKLAAKGSRKRAKAARKTGSAVETALGTEALRHTSLGVTWGVGLSPFITKNLANAQVDGEIWTGDLNYWEEVRAGKRPLDVHLNYGANIGVPQFSYGYQRMGGNTFHVPGGVKLDNRGRELKVSWPYVASLGVGYVKARNENEYDRGSYGTVGGGIPVAGIGPVGLNAGLGLRLYHPAFKPVVKWVEGKVAKVGAKLRPVFAPVGRAFAGFKNMLRPHRDSEAETIAAAEPPANAAE
jgi:hypothetical protein